jgi:DNA-binding IclR family transcriptional regulator
MVERSFHALEIAMATRTGTQSIDRASQLLVHVVEEDDAPTVGELAQLAGLPKSTTSRLVSALERQGLVQRDPGRGAISPGPVLLRYARRETSAPDLVELAADALDRLARASGETVNLGVATSAAVEMLDQRDSRHILGSTNWVGQRVPRTIVDLAALRRDLERTRARGYATAVDELEPGLWAVAAPVRDAGGTVVAALSISGPTVRLHEGLLDELGRLVRDEAATLSTRIGYDDAKRGAA